MQAVLVLRAKRPVGPRRAQGMVCAESPCRTRHLPICDGRRGHPGAESAWARQRPAARTFDGAPRTSRPAPAHAGPASSRGRRTHRPAAPSLFLAPAARRAADSVSRSRRRRRRAPLHLLLLLPPRRPRAAADSRDACRQPAAADLLMLGAQSPTTAMLCYRHDTLSHRANVQHAMRNNTHGQKKVKRAKQSLIPGSNW